MTGRGPRGARRSVTHEEERGPNDSVPFIPEEFPIGLARHARTGLHHLVRVVEREAIGRTRFEPTIAAANALLLADKPNQLIGAAEALGPLGSGRVWETSDFVDAVRDEGLFVGSASRPLFAESFFEPGTLGYPTRRYAQINKPTERDAADAVEAYGMFDRGLFSHLVHAQGDRSKVVVTEPVSWWSATRGLLSALVRIGATARRWQDEATVLEGAGFASLRGHAMEKLGEREGDVLFYLPIFANVGVPPVRSRDGAPEACANLWELVDRLPLQALHAVTIAGHNDFMVVSGETLDEVGAGGETSLWAREIGWLRGVDRGLAYLAVLGNPSDQGRLAERLFNAVDDLLYSTRLTLTYRADATDEVNIIPPDLPTALWGLVRSHPKHYMLACDQCHKVLFSTTRGPDRRFCSNGCRMAYLRGHEE